TVPAAIDSLLPDAGECCGLCATYDRARSAGSTRAGIVARVRPDHGRYLRAPALRHLLRPAVDDDQRLQLVRGVRSRYVEPAETQGHFRPRGSARLLPRSSFAHGCPRVRVHAVAIYRAGAVRRDS